MEQQQQQPLPSIVHAMGERKQRTLRLSINARERRRMHDLNDALDELRSVVRLTRLSSVRHSCHSSLLDSLRTFTVGSKVE